MSKGQIIVSDEANGDITVEIYSNNINDKDSKANLFVAWVAANWQEMILLFRAQLATAQQEATGEQPIAKPSSPILGENGAPIDTQQCIVESAADPQQTLFNSPTAEFNGA